MSYFNFFNYFKIEAAEMRFLRPMAEYTLWDKKGSSGLREQLAFLILIQIIAL